MLVVKGLGLSFLANFICINFLLLLLRCRHCQKKYSTQKNLLKHHQLCHQDVAISNVSDDAVYNYTSMFITLGLFRAVHNQAIQMGNGETVLLLYK